MESMPLLAADPPIDDDSFQYEVQIMPTELQKHYVYACASLSIGIAQLSEGVAVLAMAMLWPDSIFPVTLWVLSRTFETDFCDRWTSQLLHSRKSRLYLCVSSLLVQGAAVVLMTSVLAAAQNWLSLLIFIPSDGIQRVSAQVFRSSFQLDWCRLLTNDQIAPYTRFVKQIQNVTLVGQLVVPIVAAACLQCFGAVDSLKLLRFAVILVITVEIGLLLMLYNTCYALRLPRVPDPTIPDSAIAATAVAQVPEAAAAATIAASEEDPGVVATYVFGRLGLRRPPVRRVVKYIKRRPLPVIGSVGMIFIRTSLLTLGPQMLWFLWKSHVPLLLLGCLRSAQIGTRSIKFLHFIPLSLAAFSLFAGTALSLVLLWTSPGYMLAIVIAAAWVGVPKLEVTTRQVVDHVVADPAAQQLYCDSEASLQVWWALIMQASPIIWPTMQGFRWPAIISGIFTFCGILMILGARYAVLR